MKAISEQKRKIMPLERLCNSGEQDANEITRRIEAIKVLHESQKDGIRLREVKIKQLEFLNSKIAGELSSSTCSRDRLRIEVESAYKEKERLEDTLALIRRQYEKNSSSYHAKENLSHALVRKLENFKSRQDQLECKLEARIRGHTRFQSLCGHNEELVQCKMDLEKQIEACLNRNVHPWQLNEFKFSEKFEKLQKMRRLQNRFNLSRSRVERTQSDIKRLESEISSESDTLQPNTAAELFKLKSRLSHDNIEVGRMETQITQELRPAYNKAIQVILGLRRELKDLENRFMKEYRPT